MDTYRKRILSVDLTNRTLSEGPLDIELVHDYIGGRGFGAKILYDNVNPGIDPLGEENLLIFTAGVLAGTSSQATGRWKIFFKSPLTGTCFKSSGGGQFGAEMVFAGFEVITIKGIADKPVYLWICDRHYELRDAAYLWGLDCNDTHTLIREELRDPNVRIACIGPAGENRVNYAGVFSDRRSAARGGAGTVMATKNLKAIAIRGHRAVELADKAGFVAAVKEQVKRYKANPRFEVFSVKGTQSLAERINKFGMFATKNHQESVLPDWEKIGTSAFDKLRVGKRRCHNCMVGCASITKVDTGRYSGAWVEGPEFETIWAFSGPIGVADAGLSIAANQLCDALGMDTISTGNTLGFAYELYEKGIITKKDTGGLELTWGNGDPVLTLIRQIANREGLGDILAEGTRRAARRIGKGAEQYAMQVKGLEMPAYDPRGAKAQGLNMITASHGADHGTGFAHTEISGEIDRVTVKDKGKLCKWFQDRTAFMESAILCEFISVYYGMDAEIYGRLLSAATGVRDFADPDYLWHVGERIFNLERMFIVRDGFGRKDDVFPTRITTEPIPSGPSSGQVFEEDLLLADYYQARGWDPETGIPTLAKLKELGLDFTIR
jgi:aldehyde:ferredoxin oxidoreductase